MVIKLAIFQIRQIFFCNLEAKTPILFDGIDMAHILKLDDIEVLVLADWQWSLFDKTILHQREPTLLLLKRFFRKSLSQTRPAFPCRPCVLTISDIKVIHDFSSVIVLFTISFITFKGFFKWTYLLKTAPNLLVLVFYGCCFIFFKDSFSKVNSYWWLSG